MFSELKVRIQRDFFENKKYTYDEYIDIGIEHLEQMAKAFEKDMYACMNVQTTGQLIVEEDWFPELRIDVFLSHTWMNDGLQFAFVGWLYSTFGLRCMIDSYIWGNFGKLTDEYNGLYSNHRKKANGGDVFDYSCSNRVLNHIVSMLHIAAVKMMDKAEAVVLFNTDEDWDIYDNRSLSRRYLPWIYTEAAIINCMRVRPLAEYRRQASDREAFMEENRISKLSEDVLENELVQWEQEYDNGDKDIHPLDILYKLLYTIEYA